MNKYIILLAILSCDSIAEDFTEIKLIPFIGESLHRDINNIYFSSVKPLLEGEQKSKYSVYEVYEIQEAKRRAEREDIRLNKLETQQIIKESVKYASAYEDLDGDGYSNRTEWKQGTDPADKDSRPYTYSPISLNEYYKKH